MMKNKLIAIIALLITGSVLANPSPYAGQEARRISSLSADEIRGLLAGEGMGFARAAELNRHPGPKHVLDLADQLELSEQQLEKTRSVFKDMQTKAIELGVQLVRQEQALDNLFEEGQVSPQALDDRLAAIGTTRARLRGVHLHAHLQMRKLLTVDQIQRYDQLRGYRHGGNHEVHEH